MSRGSNSAECAAGIMWSGAETDMIGTNVSVLASDGKTGLPPLSSYSDAAKKKKKGHIANVGSNLCTG